MKETATDGDRFGKAWAIYEEAFPEDERRELPQQRELLSNQDYNFFSVEDNGEVVGLMGVWWLGENSFIEHCAVRKDLRNKGIGSKLIGDYLRRTDGIVVLETERPGMSDMAERRIGFWQRNGFYLNSYDYIQPPYGPGKPPVPLFLMTHPGKISEDEFEEVRRKLHQKVYGLAEPLVKIID